MPSGADTDMQLMRRAIALSIEKMRDGAGGPFGAVIARGAEVIAEGHNQVTSTNDPTAHAEVIAIRAACRTLNTFELSNTTIYTSCEPCPMCLSAIYWARIERIVFANTRDEAAAIGFDDAFLYREIALPVEQRSMTTQRLLGEEARRAFQMWNDKADKQRY